jgi:hypothetical protein
VTQPHDEDWRAIVDNFGETPDAELIAAEVSPFAPAHPPTDEGAEEDAPWRGDSWSDEGRFVPPPPPPLPSLPLVQRAAWASLIGGPTLLLIFLFIGFRPPTWFTLALVVATVGSFGYLLFWVPRTPREPWEDGAQI